MNDDALLAELDGFDEETKEVPNSKPILSSKPAADEEPEEDIYEIESTYHDKNDMCSVAVMEHEIQFLETKCSKIEKNDPDLEFYKD